MNEVKFINNIPLCDTTARTEVSKLSEEKVDLPKDADGNLLTPQEGQTLLFRADGTTYYGTPSTSGGGTEQELTENLKNVAGYSDYYGIGTLYENATLNEDGTTYSTTLDAKIRDASFGIIGNGDNGEYYYLSYFGQEVSGGKLCIDFDTSLITSLEAKIAFTNKPVTPVFGTKTTYNIEKLLLPDEFSGGSGNVVINKYNTTKVWKSVNITGKFTVDVPKGYYPLISMRKLGTIIVDESINTNALAVKYFYDHVTVTHKCVSETEKNETVELELGIDKDYAQDYGVSTLSLVTGESGTIADKTGLDAGFASVIESAKNEWLTEANGNIDKIPLIIHTDIHGNFSKPLWDTISGLVDWYDVGKVINLGDTVDTYVDSDTENPLTKCADLERYISSMESVPYSKRIEIFGNHDTWQINGDAYNGLTPQNYLYKYFRNIYARRFDNHGNFVTYDDNYNVKYVVVSGFAYDSTKGGYSHYIIPSATIDSIIEELKKADGYDVIILSHVPLSAVNFKSINDLWVGRKTKTSGSVTDEYGVVHEFDFTSCDGELLCALHGHQHEDGHEYVNDALLSNWFDAYYISPKAVHFVLVDRENGQLNIWKVDETPQYVNYQIPFNKPEFTLTSISATYTGGDVTVGTDVNSLTGITVTAHYSDGSTSNVTGYTLSGTIAEGINTITVSYGGKTTTFIVTGVAESGGEETEVSNETTWTDGVAYTYTPVHGEALVTDLNSGDIKVYETWSRTPHLYCEGASKLRFEIVVASSTMGDSYNNTFGAFYDADKNFVQRLGFGGIDNMTVGAYLDVDIPVNAVYFIISHKNIVIEQPYIKFIPFNKPELQTETLEAVWSRDYPDVNTFEYEEIPNGVEGQYYTVIKQGNIKGGLLKGTFDDTNVKGFNMKLYIFDADGNPYLQSVYTDVFDGLTVPAYKGTGSNQGQGFGIVESQFSVQLPEGCTCIACLRRNAITSVDGTIKTNLQFGQWVMNGGIVFTVTEQG